MDRPKVLLLGKIEHAIHTWAEIARIADVLTPLSTDRAGFLSECRAGAFAGVSVVYRTFDSTALTGRVDAEVVAAVFPPTPASPPPLRRFICHNGAGYDSVDVAACTARGVRVANAPTAADDATADLAIWLVIGALRNLNPGMQTLRQGRWRGGDADGPVPALGRDPQGKTLGILGMGGIGRKLARRARAFGMRVRYHNRARLAPELEGEEREGEYEYVGFGELLRSSDVLSLNVPLNPQTHHLISTAQFAQMKRGAVLVNTSRGAVVDEAALAAALRTGRVAAAGLDVHEGEPGRVRAELAADPRVLMTPHLGTWTAETQARVEEWTLSNVRMALERGELRSGVPEQRGMEGEGEVEWDGRAMDG